MSHAYQMPPRCQSCGHMFTAPASSCPACGAPQASANLPQVAVYAVQPQKSVALAVILSLLWLGLGHLYVGKVAPGIIFGIVDLILAIFALTGVGLIIAVPAWVILVPLVTILAGVA